MGNVQLFVLNTLVCFCSPHVWVMPIREMNRALGHLCAHMYGHKSPVKYFDENSSNSSLFKFPTNPYPWNMSLFNKNRNVIFQVDPHKQPLEAAS